MDRRTFMLQPDVTALLSQGLVAQMFQESGSAVPPAHPEAASCCLNWNQLVLDIVQLN